LSELYERYLAFVGPITTVTIENKENASELIIIQLLREIGEKLDKILEKL